MRKKKKMFLAKIRYMLFVIYVLLLFIVLASSRSSAETKLITKVSGITYTYQTDKNTAYITKISWPLKKKISTIKIPKKVGGKVVKCIGENGYDEYTCYNVFGIYESDDLIKYPNNIYRAMKKIKKIVIPDTVKYIREPALSFLPKGITINIPRDLEEGYEEYIWTKWKKIISPSKPKKFISKNNFILSRNGKKCYCYAGKEKKSLRIPYGVNIIGKKAFLYTKYNKIYIPSTLRDVENYAFGKNKNAKLIFAPQSRYLIKKNGCIYTKKGKKLIFMITSSGNVEIPEGVKKIPAGFGCFGKFKKVVFPRSLKIFNGSWDSAMIRANDFKMVFKSPNPPNVINSFSDCAPTLIVPKGAKKKYQKAHFDVTE